MGDNYRGLIAAVTATVALLLTLVSNFWCGYVSKTVTALDFGQSRDVTFGIWSFQSYAVAVDSNGNINTFRTCRFYGDAFQPDSNWKASMAMTIIATVIGGIAMISMNCLSWMSSLQWMWKGTMVLCVLAAVFQGLTFLFFSSNGCSSGVGTSPDGFSINWYRCRLSGGAIVSVFAIIAWIVAMFIASWADPEKGEEEATEEKKEEAAVEDESPSRRETPK